MGKIVPYVIRDIIRSRIIIAYALILLAASFGLFHLGGDVSKGLIGMLSLVLLVVPLVCLIFGTIHFYNSYEFIELLASQPLNRGAILLGEYLGVVIALCGALLIGAGIPVLLYAATPTGFTLLAVGIVLTLIFVAIAFLGAVATRDKARGVGLAMLVWFYFALLHGGVMLLLLFAF
jgi:Cu-processing system permease protein